ncbi:MAG: MBL fold metallo-hydrolase [Rhizobiaceae bacterium]|nr:MBL fold metallo-hydrolase [Rhizobiaceae bacterium]
MIVIGFNGLFRLIFVTFSVVILSGFSGSSYLKKRSSNDILPVSSIYDDFNVVFFGSSSFLIEAGATQLLIDGFVTRKKHMFIGRIAPDPYMIVDVIRRFRICTSKPHPAKICAHPKKRRLKAVIPVHGHYDHALDSTYFAAWANADLYGDTSIQVLKQASQEHSPGRTEFEWENFHFEDIFTDDKTGQNTRHLVIGDLKVTLIKTKHAKNIATSLLKPKTSERIRFPTKLRNMGLGVSVSVLVEYKNKRFLILPSAGPFVPSFKDGELAADVVFLGLGGLGLVWKHTRQDYWNNIINATDPKRVIPIHWDGDMVQFNKDKQKNFSVAPVQSFDSTLKFYEELASKRSKKIEIIFAPAEARFNPFSGLN